MSPKTLLYAEDDPDDVLLLRHALRKAGVALNLVTASDGQEVVDYLSGSGKFAERTQFPLPSLLLLDIHLPKRSGLEVLKWVRQHPTLDALVVLMFTSSELDLDVYGSYRLRANGYLVKPTTPSRLVELCKALHEFWFSFNILPPDITRYSDVPGSTVAPLIEEVRGDA